jgi:hypothetical protein
MMKRFLQMLPGQRLILIRVETPQPSPAALVAKSAPPEPEPEPLWLVFLLWLLATLGRPLVNLHKKGGQIGAAEAAFFRAIRTIRATWPPPLPGRLAVLAILAGALWYVVLDNLAGGYIEKVVGV